ncbi:MAG: hypothetical protein JWR90_2670 [Marmoricola sp.]|jgi:hypothetical protein|nr:hypothetical protein [Marmoricola sp.]
MRGGYGTSDHGTLADRQRTAAPEVHAGPARHCHVDGQPSLLVEWRRGATGWEGRVISVVWLESIGWASVERWLPATDIGR